jgi:hypothetical protein
MDAMVTAITAAAEVRKEVFTEFLEVKMDKGGWTGQSRRAGFVPQSNISLSHDLGLRRP